jgi:hypothetical protein
MVLTQTLKPNVLSIIYGTTKSRALIQNTVFPQHVQPVPFGSISRVRTKTPGLKRETWATRLLLHAFPVRTTKRHRSEYRKTCAFELGTHFSFNNSTTITSIGCFPAFTSACMVFGGFAGSQYAFPVSHTCSSDFPS